jgi:hypothetical protein
MCKSRFTEEQIVAILQEYETGAKADEHITRKFNGNSLTKEKDVITVYLKRI